MQLRPVEQEEDDSIWSRPLLSVVRGRSRTAATASWALLVSLAMLAVGVAIVGQLAHENRVLADRGELATVLVLQPDEGGSSILEGEYTSGPVGQEVVVDRLVSDPAEGDVITVLFDPRHPDTVVEASGRLWRVADFAGPGLFTCAATGLVVMDVSIVQRRRRQERRTRGRHRRVAARRVRAGDGPAARRGGRRRGRRAA